MKRVQRKRTKGYRLPKNAVYVGRPTKWGNPYELANHTRDTCLILYASWLLSSMLADKHFLDALRGKDLACWCPLDYRCHADVLLKVLNAQKS